MHTERLDAILPQDLLLTTIHIPQTNIHQLANAQRRPLPPLTILSLCSPISIRMSINPIRRLSTLPLSTNPIKDTLLLTARQARQERTRHTMNITTIARLRRIDIGVGIDPDNSNLATQSLTHGSRAAADGANRNAVVTAQRQRKPSLARVGVHLVRDLVCHG